MFARIVTPRDGQAQGTVLIDPTTEKPIEGLAITDIEVTISVNDITRAKVTCILLSTDIYAECKLFFDSIRDGKRYELVEVCNIEFPKNENGIIDVSDLSTTVAKKLVKGNE